MSEYLTTGQLIDRLQVNETAEAVGFPEMKLQYRDEGLVYVSEEGVTDRTKGVNGHFFINSDFTKDMKWRILPQYVSFEEAMKALKEDKTVYFRGTNKHHCNEEVTSTDAKLRRIDHTGIGEYALLDLIDGKWLIKQ